ncbi:MAG: Sua5/YciO/YrdC/YwlC family protein, partial [Candidatus Cloacimonadota bacterium]|nr:Sua5/YciO/YrdC/YwlC family protein [Candidatus Cloacimonadota bacterium]
VNTKPKIEEFYRALLTEKPEVSVIIEQTIEFSDEVTCDENTFQIAPSKKQGEISALIPPDIATCKICLAEIEDEKNRHYNYPFTNCTNCGPRFSIIKQLPYDRKNTTMDEFEMCPDCKEEYKTISDRRFHAQPNACPECGPQISLFKKENDTVNKIAHSENSLEKTINLLKSGEILAIKGLGGFHIVCDALNIGTVKKLRKLKSRPQKPFALMADKISTIEKYCFVSKEERKMLSGQQKPIVLLKRKSKNSLPQIAPEISHLGFMLPYTPLHYLLLREMHLLVMTSGNVANEALEKENDSAYKNLSKYSKYFLIYNRKIFNRVDDSVVKFCGKEKIIIRKARGFTPFPIKLKSRSSVPLDSIMKEAKSGIQPSKSIELSRPSEIKKIKAFHGINQGPFPDDEPIFAA